MNIATNYNYNPSCKATYVKDVKRLVIPMSNGKKIFLGTKDKNFMEAFITKPVDKSPNGKDAIEAYFQTEYKKGGLLGEDISEFSGKVCDAIANNSVKLDCGAELITGASDIKVFLKELFKAIVG